MAAFTLTPGTDNFTGLTSESNFYNFTPSTLSSDDSVTGGASGTFVDVLVMTGAGIVTAGQFANVRNIEQLNLADGGDNVTLTNGLVQDASTAFFTVIDGNGDDTVDASTITSKAIAFVASSGNETFRGGSRDDVFAFTAAGLGSADTVVGGAGFDSLQITTGGAVGASAFAGVSGVDALTLSNAGNSVALSNSLGKLVMPITSTPQVL